MGGHESGELAAEVAVETIRYYIDSSSDRQDVDFPFGYSPQLSLNSNRLRTALRLANRDVWRSAANSVQNAGMGTTIAAILVEGHTAALAHVGDSRIYRWTTGALERWTEDDNMVDGLVRRGLLAPADAIHHPMRNVLTQAAGSQEDLDPHCRDETLTAGDCMVIASDGLHSVAEDAEIEAVVGASHSAESRACALRDLALRRGAPDNVSVIVLRYD